MEDIKDMEKKSKKERQKIDAHLSDSTLPVHDDDSVQENDEQLTKGEVDVIDADLAEAADVIMHRLKHEPFSVVLQIGHPQSPTFHQVHLGHIAREIKGRL